MLLYLLSLLSWRKGGGTGDEKQGRTEGWGGEGDENGEIGRRGVSDEEGKGRVNGENSVRLGEKGERKWGDCSYEERKKERKVAENENGRE